LDQGAQLFQVARCRGSVRPSELTRDSVSTYRSTQRDSHAPICPARCAPITPFDNHSASCCAESRHGNYRTDVLRGHVMEGPAGYRLPPDPQNGPVTGPAQVASHVP